MMKRDEHAGRRGRPEQEKLDKLSKWAQDYISIIERDVQNARDELAMIGGDVPEGEEAPIKVTNYIQTFSFPEGYSFLWEEPSDRDWNREVRVRPTDDGQGLQIQASEPIIISPTASNTVDIRFKREI